MNKYIDIVENPNSHSKDRNIEQEKTRIPIGQQLRYQYKILVLFFYYTHICVHLNTHIFFF